MNVPKNVTESIKENNIKGLRKSANKDNDPSSLESEENFPLEYQVFALAFLQPGAIQQFNDHLEPEMIGALQGNRGLYEFYRAMLDFWGLTQIDPIEPIAFKSWLENETDLQDSMGGAVGVKLFIDTILGLELSDIDTVIKIIKFRSNKRKQLDYLQELQGVLSNKESKSTDDLERISRLTGLIRELESELDYNPLDSLTVADDIANRADDLVNVPDFIPTQFPALNKALGYTEDAGFFRGQVHAITAESGKGKSTFAKTLVSHWADLGYKTLFVNFEEAVGHWERILMTQIIGENVYSKADTWTESEKHDRINKFKKKLNEWGDNFMVKHDPDSLFYDDLEIWIRDVVTRGDIDLDVVVIDTLQSLVGKGSGPRWADFEQMMIRLERLARELNAVFIITAQQNVNKEKEGREIVLRSDVGGSITIVQKSAVVIAITERSLITGDDSESPNIMQLQIPKNRITGQEFALDPPLVEYVDESKTYIEYKIPPKENYQKANVQDNSELADLAKDVLGDNFI